MGGGTGERDGRSVFLFKCAESLERVEPAAISGQGEGGNGGKAIKSSRTDFASSRVFRVLYLVNRSRWGQHILT